MKSMNLTQKRLVWSGAFLLLASSFLSTAALAQEPAQQKPHGVVLEGDVRAQGVALDNGDLGGSGDDNNDTAALQANVRLTAGLSDNTSFFGEARGVAGAGDGGFESSDTGNVARDNSYLELRQAYLQFDQPEGTPFAIRAGRQKIRDSYGLWWNQNFDSVAALYESTLFTGQVVAGENLFSYRTGDDDFRENDQNIASILAEGSWQYRYDHFIEGRLLFQDDHSDVDVGDVFSPDDIDDGESNLVWGGVRAAGKAQVFGEGKTLYRVDLMGVTGHEDIASTVPAGGNSVVNAVDGKHVSGWGLDAATDVPLPNSSALVHLGYAFGSGDAHPGDNNDHSFRQNELSGNFSRIGALSENTDNYGAVLRPELSNIHILSAGLTAPVLSASDAGVIYRYYRLSARADALPSSGVNGALTGDDKDVGQEVDVLFNMDISKEANLNVKGVKDLALRTSLGFFRAGDAYGADDGEVATRGLVEVKASF